MITTTRMASVSLAYGDLVALIDELDARIHSLGEESEAAKGAGDATRAAQRSARCDHVQRIREYLDVCAGNLAEQEGLHAAMAAAADPGSAQVRR